MKATMNTLSIGNDYREGLKKKYIRLWFLSIIFKVIVPVFFGLICIHAYDKAMTDGQLQLVLAFLFSMLGFLIVYRFEQIVSSKLFELKNIIQRSKFKSVETKPAPHDFYIDSIYVSDLSGKGKLVSEVSLDNENNLMNARIVIKCRYDKEVNTIVIAPGYLEDEEFIDAHQMNIKSALKLGKVEIGQVIKVNDYRIETIKSNSELLAFEMPYVVIK